MKYLFDTSAWIEYMEGSKAGEKVNKLIQDSSAEIITLPLILGELVSKAQRKSEKGKSAYDIVTNKAKISMVSAKEALEAGLLHAKERKRGSAFSLVDAMILTSAQAVGAKVVTSDTQFTSFGNVILI